MLMTVEKTTQPRKTKMQDKKKKTEKKIKVRDLKARKDAKGGMMKARLPVFNPQTHNQGINQSQSQG